MYTDSKKRSFVKALTYRVLIIMADAVVVFVITHRFDITVSVVAFTNITSTLLYFIHERSWGRVEWGKVPHRP